MSFWAHITFHKSGRFLSQAYQKCFKLLGASVFKKKKSADFIMWTHQAHFVEEVDFSIFDTENMWYMCLMCADTCPKFDTTEDLI